MIDVATKVRENKLRRLAVRRGLRLTKSKRHDPRGIDFGRYALIDHRGKAVNPPLAGSFIHSWTIDEVENYLNNGKEKR